MTSRMLIVQTEGHMPEKSPKMVWMQMVEQTGIHPMRLGELIEMGWIDPVVTQAREYLFSEADVRRVRKLMRLCRDFELSTLAGSIIVDLIHRIEELEQENRQLRSLL